MKPHILFSLAAVVIVSGCDRANNASGTGGNTQSETTGGRQQEQPKQSPQEKEAMEIGKKLFAQRWLQEGDSWFTRSTANSLGSNLLQAKIDFRLGSEAISEADRLNGIQWKGNVGFVAKLWRAYIIYNSGLEKWEDWRDGGLFVPDVTLTLRNGKWSVEDDGYWNNFTRPSLKSLPPR